MAQQGRSNREERGGGRNQKKAPSARGRQSVSEIGKQGGKKASQSKEHMAEIGKKSGTQFRSGSRKRASGE